MKLSILLDRLWKIIFHPKFKICKLWGRGTLAVYNLMIFGISGCFITLSSACVVQAGSEKWGEKKIELMYSCISGYLQRVSRRQTDRQTELIWHSMRANTKLPNLHVARTVTWRLRVECVTNWTDQSPWEANRNSMKKPPPSPLCSSKIHHRVHNSPPLISILSHMEPIHTLSPTPSRSILTPSPTHAQTLRVVSLL